MALDFDDLMCKVKELAQDEAENFIELGKHLEQMRTLEPGRLRAEIEDATGIKSRKAYYLANIGAALFGAKIAKKRLKDIGWTKLSLIAPYLDVTNAEELLAVAETNTSMGIKEFLSGRTQSTHVVQFRFTDKQFDDLSLALSKFGAVPKGRTIESKEEALMKLVRKSLKES